MIATPSQGRIASSDWPVSSSGFCSCSSSDATIRPLRRRVAVQFKTVRKCFTSLNRHSQCSWRASLPHDSVSIERSPPEDSVLPLLDCTEDLRLYMDELKALQKMVEDIIRGGDIEKAMVLVEANYEALMAQLEQGSKGLEQAAMLDVLIQLSIGLRDPEAIQQMLDQMKDVLLEFGLLQPMADMFWEHLGSAYLALGQDEDSLICYQRSIEIQETVLGKNSPVLVDTLLGLAGVYKVTGESEMAKDVYRRAISILEGLQDISCEELVEPLLHLGYLLLEERDVDEAEACLRRALNIAKETIKEGIGRVGIVTCALARVKCTKGDYDKAADLYQEGLQILRSSGYWSRQDAVVENIRIEIAEFLSLIGRTREAQDLFEESLHEKQKAVGANSPRLVVHLQNLATSYAEEGRFEQCEPLLRHSLKLVTTSLGPKAPQVSVPLLFLATALHHLKKDTEAESLAREALKIRENNFPEDHPLMGEALQVLATILHSRHKNAEALTLAERALGIKEKQVGKDSLELAVILDLLLEIMDSLGRTGETLPLIERLERLTAK